MLHRLNKKCGIPGKKWYYTFMGERNEDLPLRRAKAPLFFRGRSFIKVSVLKFLDVLTNSIDLHNIDTYRISNVERMDNLQSRKLREHLIWRQGTKLEILQMENRGRMPLVNTAWTYYVPAVMILQRMEMKGELKGHFESGTQFACSENGRIPSKTVVKSLKHSFQSKKSNGWKKRRSV
jgi:hypothetical protein